MISTYRARTRAYLFASRFTRGMTLGVRGVVTDADSRVLLVRHSYVPGWYLPGGGVEAGETLEAALKRELSEEGGIELAGPAELVGIYLNRQISRRDHVALFHCPHWRQGDWRPGAEIVEAGFFARDALPAGITRATVQRLAELFDGTARSEIW